MEPRLKVMTVLGTRPEAIKMAPVIQRLAAQPDQISVRVCVTAQHRAMLDQVLGLFDLTPDHDLNVMAKGQTPSQVAARIIEGLAPVLSRERPDWVLVQGDTTTTAAAALAASYAGVRIGHIEAGLRTYDPTQPFPEEINRKLVTAVAHHHFAPTPGARDNLLAEGVPAERISITGNTGIDALFTVAANLDPQPNGDAWGRVPAADRIILATAHRRENLGRPLEHICQALQDVVHRGQGTVHVVFPVHPRPEVSATAQRLLAGIPNVVLCEPLGYVDLIRLMMRCDLVITDSGGLQEEAPSLGKPVVVLRELTERPEAVDAGMACLVGTDRQKIVDAADRFLARTSARAPSRATLCYGDGMAADRIAGLLLGRAEADWCPDTTASESRNRRF